MTAFIAIAAAMSAVAVFFVVPGMAGSRAGFRRARAAWIVAAAIPLAAGIMYFHAGTPRALEPAQGSGQEAAQARPSIGPAQIEAMVARLAQRLQERQDDPDGWRELARSYETLGRFELAIDAYRHLEKLQPEDADMLTDYAVTLAISRGRSLSGEPEALIKRALEVDPDNVQALALAGSAAFERADYDNAIKPWKRVLALVPAASDAAASIADSIGKAEALAARSLAGKPANQAKIIE